MFWQFERNNRETDRSVCFILAISVYRNCQNPENWPTCIKTTSIMPFRKFYYSWIHSIHCLPEELEKFFGSDDHKYCHSIYQWIVSLWWKKKTTAGRRTTTINQKGIKKNRAGPVLSGSVEDSFCSSIITLVDFLFNTHTHTLLMFAVNSPSYKLVHVISCWWNYKLLCAIACVNLSMLWQHVVIVKKINMEAVKFPNSYV